MQYRTRRLEAQRDISHGAEFVRKGDKFQASDTDTEYLVSTGFAKEHHAAAPAAPLSQTRGRHAAQTVKPAETETTTAPPAENRYVSIGSTRFSDGAVQTEDSLAAEAGQDPQA